MMVAKLKWPTKRLGDLAEFRNGVNYNKSSFGMGIKVVGVSDFQDYTKPRYDELEQINPEGIVTERNILRDGDIVFVRSNGNRELIGRSLFIEQPPEEVIYLLLQTHRLGSGRAKDLAAKSNSARSSPRTSPISHFQTWTPSIDAVATEPDCDAASARLS